jgi:hypothetical protein
MNVSLSSRPARWVALALGVVVMLGGCSRGYYRQQADQDVYSLVSQTADDPRWSLANYTIEVDPRSRMYDPYPADSEPMPPDDPTSHRYMECVDGMRGYRCWAKFGYTKLRENPDWHHFLPVDDKGMVVLNLNQAIQMARLQSPSYQNELEDLYLSALDVSFQRFRFDTQFFGGNDTYFTADGPERSGTASSLLTTESSLQMTKLFATGGELVVGLANTLMWEFSGANTSTASTLLDFSLVQPLLRGGGRARVLEVLTVAERNLLANVRQMERFQRGFYVQVSTGGAAGTGPSQAGSVLGTGVGSFLRSGTASAGGYIGLLQEQQEIRNQMFNVVALRESLAQLDASYQAGRIDRFQVDLARQALYNAQSQLLTSRTSYETSLDGFKATLGLPPELPIKIEDPMLSQFDLISNDLRKTQRSLADIQSAVGELIILLRRQAAGADPTGDGQFRKTLDDLAVHMQLVANESKQVVDYVPSVSEDLDHLAKQLPARTNALDLLIKRIRSQRQDVDISMLDTDRVRRLPKQLRNDLAIIKARIDATPEQVAELRGHITQFTADLDRLAPAALRTRFTKLVAQVPDQLQKIANDVLELSLIQAKARTESITVLPISLAPEKALKIACINRRDWMNARAALVDSWRLIEFHANDLESNLDIVFEGDLSTVGANPVKFQGTTGRLRVGLEFDAPLTRLSERNVYRAALIDYQRARRTYYQRVDAVSRSLRNNLRTIELNQLNFELRRAATRVAISQVELIRLRLNEPPKPGASGQFGATTARDLVTALSALLSVQNQYLGVWVNYEVLRRNLDFNMGTMQVDHNGVWIDPGPIDAEKVAQMLGGTFQPGSPELLDPTLAEEIPLPLLGAP